MTESKRLTPKEFYHENFSNDYCMAPANSVFENCGYAVLRIESITPNNFYLTKSRNRWELIKELAANHGDQVYVTGKRVFVDSPALAIVLLFQYDGWLINSPT